ncbi:MAG: hypothetical protein J0L92_14460 [Deltaproteobacteria bacterium]|nr:hypothetical protein [Deltaproteobacteria bacterium]
MTREAALEVLARLPAPSVQVNEVTGIITRGPHEAVEAVWALGRRGLRLEEQERDLLENAIAHYERLATLDTDSPGAAMSVTLRRLSSMFLPDVLGDAAIPHLIEELACAGGRKFVLYELHRLGRPPREVVISLSVMDYLEPDRVQDYVRTRCAYDDTLAAFLRAAADPEATRALALGSLGHDPERLRGVWLEHRDRLPPWRVETGFAPLGLVPRDSGVAFLIGQDTRRWVRGFEVQLWPQFGLRTLPEMSLYSLSRHDGERRLVLIAPPDDDSLVESLALVAHCDRLRDAIARAHENDEWPSIEGLLCLPRIERVLAPHGVVAIDWRDAEHSEAIRVGGLTPHTFDRPFLIIDWDIRREEALGVGLVTGPLLLEDTLTAVDASARGEGPFVDR